MKSPKRQDLPGLGKLWIVATPIGNLEDLSPRAQRILAESSIILCEDTRRTQVLLTALKLKGPRLERFDAHTSPQRVEELASQLQEGATLSLVSDAGTPAISDPASQLVKRAHELGVIVSPVPGPSAVTALLSVAGLLESEFTFCGFFPRKDSERRKILKEVMECCFCRTFIWFESPERIQSALEVLAEMAPDARVAAAKELTKVHEKIVSGSAVEVSALVTREIELEGPRGEWCFSSCFRPFEKPMMEEWIKPLELLIQCGVSPSEATKNVSRVFGVPKNRIYERALKISGKKSNGGIDG